jgi:hypothetical protein
MFEVAARMKFQHVHSSVAATVGGCNSRGRCRQLSANFHSRQS